MPGPFRQRALVAARAFADMLGLPAFAGTPYPTGGVANKAQNTTELGGSGTNNFGGFIRGEDFDAEMDSLTGIKNLDIMRRSDAQTNAAISVVTQPIRAASKSIDPGDNSDASKVQADFAEWNLFSGSGGIVWDNTLREALLMLVFGFYLFEKVWALQEDGPWAGHWYLRKLAPRPPKTIWQWFTDESGELISIKQLAVKSGTFQFLDIPVEKLVRFTYNQEGDNYAGMSILRSAYPHWKIKNQLYIVDAIRAVRFGAGIPRAKLAAGYAPNAKDMSAIVTMLQGMVSHEHSYLIENAQTTFDILTPQGGSGTQTAILPTINHHNEQITRNVLATFLDMGGRSMGGSNALGSSAINFFSNAVNAVADYIADVFNKQVIKPLIDMNYAEVTNYPVLRFSGIKQDDLGDIAKIIASLSAAGMSFGDLETQNTFRERLDLPQLDEQTLASMPPPPPQGGQGGSGGPGSGGAPPQSHPAHSNAPAGTAHSNAPAGHAASAAPDVNVAHSPAAAAGARTTAVHAHPAPAAAPTHNRLQQPEGPDQPAAADVNLPPNPHAVSMRPDLTTARSNSPAGVDHTETARTADPAGKLAKAATARPDWTSAQPMKPRTTEGIDPHASRTIPPTARMDRSNGNFPSSGDADEEGHSLSEAGWSGPPRPGAQASRPNPGQGTRATPTSTLAMPAADSRELSSRPPASSRSSATATAPMVTSPVQAMPQFWRQPTEKESRILDLHEMPRRLDTARTGLLATLKAAREAQILQIAREVSRLRPADMLKPGAVSAPGVDAMVRDVVTAAREAFDYGRQTVEKELAKQRRERGKAGERKFEDWDESKHPRNDRGEFSSGGASTPDMSENEAENLRDWTGYVQNEDEGFAGAAGLNEYLRGNITDASKENKQEYKRRVALLNGLIDRSVTRRPVELVRGVDGGVAAKIAGVKNGGVIESVGFTSLTNDLHRAKAFAGPDGQVMRVLVPAHTPLLDVDKLMDAGEGEHLLKTGTRFKVNRSGKTITLEVLPHGHAGRVSIKMADWDESKHPRRDDGEFTFTLAPGPDRVDEVSRGDNADTRKIFGNLAPGHLAPQDREEGHTVEDVKLDTLTPIQRLVSAAKVKQFVVNPHLASKPLSGDRHLPLIIRTKSGINYIADGHHRLAAAVMRGETHAKARVVHAMSDTAHLHPGADPRYNPHVRPRALQFASSPQQPQRDPLPHLEASARVKVQAASDRLVASAQSEALRLQRAGWEEDEVDDALKVHLGEISDADLGRIANGTVNEGFGIGRVDAAAAAGEEVTRVTYSALLDQNTCKLCRSMDGLEWNPSDPDDAEAIEANQPPNPNCEGGDACRCELIYEIGETGGEENAA